LVPFIAPSIAFKFRFPEILPGLRQTRQRASRVSMPETAVNQNDLAAFSEDEIGVTR
jgi:hypothetical protein